MRILLESRREDTKLQEVNLYEVLRRVLYIFKI